MNIIIDVKDNPGEVLNKLLKVSKHFTLVDKQ